MFCNRYISIRNISIFMRLFSNESNKSITNVNETSHVTRANVPSTFESFKDSFQQKNISKLLNDSPVKGHDDEGSSGKWTTPVYANSANSVLKREQSLRTDRSKTDPKDTTIILFPGQGSQFLGMGNDVIDAPNVPEMFTVAKKILGYDLLHLCINGPIEHLNKTQYSQPAIFVTSLAAVERLRVTRPGEVEACVCTAGFSVGELSALVFSGAITYEDGLRLVKIRAEAMQYASELVPSGMITVLFNADARINFACRAAQEWCVRNGIEPEYAICGISNYLFPHCKVIAGHDAALEFLKMNAKDFGIRKIKRLPVSGAFHTKLMKPARDVFKAALKQIKIEDPLIPVHSNLDGRMYRNSESIRKKLPDQICLPVKWEQIMHIIYDREDGYDFPKTYECGPGNALLSVLSLVNGNARRYAFSVPV